MKIEIAEKVTNIRHTIQKEEYVKEGETDAALDIFSIKEMIPPSVRWMDPLSGTYVFEYPPQERMIYTSGMLEPEQTTYRIPLPWQIYICTLNKQKRDVKFFTRTSQLTSLDDVINHQFMPNIYRSGTPCDGAVGTSAALGPIDRCRQMIDGIWMTSFNGGCYVSSHTQIITNEKAAYKDPGGSLQPKEVIDAGFDKAFWSSRDIFPWLEEKSIEDLLTWEWKEAGPLMDVVRWQQQERNRFKLFSEHLNISFPHAK